jgi:hypothetical protein
MRLAVQQVLPHLFMEPLTMAHRRWFDRSACELTRYIGRDVQTESRPSTGKMRPRKSCRGASSSTEPSELRVGQRERRHVIAGYLG